MFKSIYKHLKHNFHHPNYLVLMLSLILVVIIPPFLELFPRGEILLYLLFIGTIFLGILYTASSAKEFIACLVIGLSGFILFIFHDDHIGLVSVSAILDFSFFTYLFVKIIRFLLNEKEVDSNTIFACISGFFILGITAAILFSLINSLVNNAFNFPEDPIFYDFIYFSFVTMTAVGFGDIHPSSSIAKSMTVMLGIIGQLYTTFLVAIIVGKYLAGERYKEQP